jgi:hypothetical protein
MSKFYSPRDHEAMVQAYMANGKSRAEAVRRVDAEEAIAAEEYDSWNETVDNELSSEDYYTGGDLA